MIDTRKEIYRWLVESVPDSLQQKIWNIGLLTGWRKNADGSFGAPNFERALVLYRLIERLRPRRVLEVGTGRGLGALTMAQAARDLDHEISILTVDVTAPETEISYPIRIDGVDTVETASCREIWGRFFDSSLLDCIQSVTGYTTRVLPALKKESRSFDLIFIDAGHDLYAVHHDLSYGMALLANGGAILMDDFAPVEEYGIGTVLASLTARDFFESVVPFPTEGLVYQSEPAAMPRGMTLLQGLKKPVDKIRRSRLLYWKFLRWLLHRSVPSRALFPAS